MGKRTTTTREYDTEGRLVRETVLEETIQQFTIYPMGHIAGCRCPLCRPDLIAIPGATVTHTACICPLAGCPLHPTGWPGRLPQTARFHLEINAGAADNYSRSHEVAAPTWRDNNAGVDR